MRGLASGRCASHGAAAPVQLATYSDIADMPAPTWQLPEPSSSTFAFTLPPPHPSLAQHVIPPSRRQSIPVWQTFNAAGPSHHAFTPDRGQSSPEATPIGPPPGTPIQAVSTESSAGSLDTEDKRQRNTLACEVSFDV